AFLIKAVLPINIISSAGEAFSSESAYGMLIVFIISALYYAVSLILLSALTRGWQSREKFRSVFIDVIVFANVGFIGFPILGELYGSAGTLYTVAYNISYQLFFFSYGLFLLEGKGKLSLRSLFGNSAIYVSIGSILLYLSGLRFPEFFQSTLTAVGGMMSPISMIIIGCEIANMDIRVIMKDRYSYLVSASRLLIVPLILAPVLKVVGISGTVATTAVLLSALPSGSLTVIMAQGMGDDTAFGARAVAQSTLLMLVTLPVIFLLTGLLF
ncbi:MAG: AEC family transporter, partial [Oscillospiraceae bacterium]